ncbi:glycosyltransferase [Desulfovibrio oxyclinae]|uniref:glycosyltransferase family protein n=1 Tax=Desulfovibrio oxyclinae TaxID=63560 RepID=UPI000370CEE3|nr:glycosyltransferase [Desulfovibrio oxyclinae]
MSKPKVAWVGGIYFRDDFARQGFDVRTVNFSGPRALNWDELCEAADCEPEVVIYTDRSLPPPLVGIESFPCLSVFYCIDSHIHEWYPLYAQGFDLCAVSLRDHMSRFRLRLDERAVFWLPPYPIRDEHPPVEQPERLWPLLFAGTVDPETTPERKVFLDRIKKLMPELEVRSGQFETLFPQAEIVLNIAERGDLNFRVFEALATGACLLTPEVGHGQSELFEDGRHLFTYPLNAPEAAAEKARELLTHPERMRTARREGLAAIDARHRRSHRAEQLAKTVRKALADSPVQQRLREVPAIHERFLRLVYLHWAQAERGSELGARYLAAGRSAPVRS